MVPCAYCEQTLVCDNCREEYVPPSPEVYEALSRPEVAVECPGCGEILVCRWCKTPYDGGADGGEEAAPPAAGTF
jgi:hypothetical protein